jgi:hypothetical protein
MSQIEDSGNLTQSEWNFVLLALDSSNEDICYEDIVGKKRKKMDPQETGQENGQETGQETGREASIENKRKNIDMIDSIFQTEHKILKIEEEIIDKVLDKLLENPPSLSIIQKVWPSIHKQMLEYIIMQDEKEILNYYGPFNLFFNNTDKIAFSTTIE